MKRTLPDHRFRPAARRGVVLLVMLSLLGLFTVIAVTFVAASGHFRRGAAIASRVEQFGDPFEIQLQQALMQIVRGSNHPQSVIGPHSLLEDIYGNADAVAGVLTPAAESAGALEIGNWLTTAGNPYPQRMFLKLGAGTSFGWDRQPGIAYVDDNNNGLVDDLTETGMGDDVLVGNTPAYPASLVPSAAVVDNVDNYYAGRVITFVSGAAAGQSCYILRSKIVGLAPGGSTILYVTPPENGAMPADYDRYVINGRPFNGTGFGSSLPVAGKPAAQLRLLDLPYNSAVEGGKYSLNGKNVPIALLPNPTSPGYRDYLTNLGAIVDADEDYDVADYQNMMLAHRAYNSTTGRYEMIAPSLHRPDLVNFFLKRSDLGYAPGTRWTDLPPPIRRKIILRPDPADHYDYTQAGFLDPTLDTDGFKPGEPFVDANGNGQYDQYVPALNGPEQFTDLNNNSQYDPGDRSYAGSTFDAILNPGDVDNDGDGVADSIWVDIGLPVTTAPDGRLVKPLVAIMVIDLDGRLNVNAHGSPAHYTTTREVDLVVDANAKDTSGAWNGGSEVQRPVNYTRRHPEYTTEERYLIGAKAVGYHQTQSLSSVAQVIDPIISSEMFPQYVTPAKWASAVENDSHAAFDWPALRSLQTPQYEIAVARANRDIVPWIEPAFGQGYSVADINLGVLLAANGLAPSMGVTLTGSNPPQPILAYSRYNVYRHLLEGSGDAALPITGRYGEQHLRRPQSGTGWTSIYYPGLGAVPRAGATYLSPAVTNTSGLYPSSAPTGPTDDNMPGLPGSGSVLGNNQREEFNNGAQGDYANPGDFDSDGALGLDLAGQPIFLQMGTPGETIDDPAEINLYRRYYPQLRLSGTTNNGHRGNMAHRDAPFTPSELERVLRSRDPGSAALSNRLNLMVSNYDYEQYSVTTEQWDVPCPHVAPTPELADALNKLGLSVTHPSIGDLLRARFYLSHNQAISVDQTARLATIAMRSYGLVAGTPSNVMSIRRKQTRLLSPDLGVGIRMNVNAPFGNGRDDNNNGVVDEPSEWPLEYVGYGSYSVKFDGNRDGNFWSGSMANPANAAAADEQARQQYAKELYCLMMLLIDQNYLMPLPTAFSNAAGTGAPEVLSQSFSPTGLPPQYQTDLGRYAQHWLTARRIAQWAINAADFRDRDSIMSSFEFDVDPFFDNDGDSNSANILAPTGNGTWDVDGNIDIPTAAAAAANDDSTKPWRGVVWGCEYADLLLTETLAFHDRRTQNHVEDNGEQVNSDMTPVTGTYKMSRVDSNGRAILTETNSNPERKYDPHWDQIRIPQGSAFVELYATANPNNPVRAPELYNNAGNLDLSRTVSDTAGTRYPVWRLAVTEGRLQANQTLTQNDVAARLAANPATCSLDPADPGFSLLPWVNSSATTSNRVTIERVVGFCDNSAGNVTFTAGLNLPPGNAPLPPSTIDVFANHATANVVVQPGQYVVVGPYRNNNGADNVTAIGRTSDTVITVNGNTTQTQSAPNNPPPPVISLHPQGFIATSPDGSNEYPIHSKSTAAVTVLGNAVNATTSPTPPTYLQIRDPVTVACSTSARLGGETNTRPVGFNISEPTNADRPTTYRLNNNANATLTIGTTTYPNGGVLSTTDALTSNDTSRRFDDIPWDGYMLDKDDNANINNKQLPRLEDHTTLRYKSVFLQRLADPTRAWHRYTNPYITIDWMPFDLTVFNGEPWATDDAEHLEHLREPGNIRRRDDPDYTGGNLAQFRVRFGSRQRGAPRFPFKGNFSNLNLWGQPNYLSPDDPGGPHADMDTRPPLTDRVSNKIGLTSVNDRYKLHSYDYVNPSSSANPPTNEFFVKWQDPLLHTLGYLNESFHYRRRLTTGSVTAAIGDIFNPSHRVTDPTIRPETRVQPNTNAAYGWLMQPDFVHPTRPPSGQAEYIQYIGQPWRPFNWLTWNNRPYAGSMELMLVPCTSPARLLHEYDMRRTALPATPGGGASNHAPWDFARSGNHYLPHVAVDSVPGYANRPPFGHLLNFFESSSAAPANNPEYALPSGRSYTAGNFFRIFEFLNVPSRFSGTQQAHANTVVNDAGSLSFRLNSGVNGGEALAWPFTAPFNLIPRFREPGRVNINTMPHLAGDPSTIWRSVINDFYPTQRYLNSSLTQNRYQTDVDRVGYTRANNRTNVANLDEVPWNPGESNVGSYYSMFSSLHSDNPSYDPRNLHSAPLTARHDSTRPALFSNPFRSYLEGYGAVATPGLAQSAATGNPLLAVDSTLLRRRDTTWNPWNEALWPDGSPASANAAPQIDPAFDPLFALNFPRPYRVSFGGTQPFSGYTANYFYRWGQVPGNSAYGPASPTNRFATMPYADNYHSRDTDYRNTDRNPFFRYQLYTKLSNLTTTRSNCYAIWVTLGYFEVERVKIGGLNSKTLPSQEGFDSGDDMPDMHRYPSGYRLLRELGSETGEVKRHKAFALFDRTIPVGFMRGENLNVDRAFLSRRILY